MTDYKYPVALLFVKNEYESLNHNTVIVVRCLRNAPKLNRQSENTYANLKESLD